MKFFFTLLLVLSSFLHAEYTLEPYSTALSKNSVPIVDIRTVDEWKETGLVKGSIPIQFFDERGQYDIRAFLEALKANVDTTKQFALICRTGSRTAMVAQFLSDKLHYKVIDIQGGIMKAYELKAPIVPYQGK